MKQTNLFAAPEKEDNDKYSTKIAAPVYEPKNQQPHILELYNKGKSSRLVNKIKQSNLEEDEKAFLLFAAQRHTVFNYEKIADYYAHASKEMQELMEDSALVIIDFEKAIQLGYVQLCQQIKDQHLEDFGE